MEIRIENSRLKYSAQKSNDLFGGLFLILSIVLSIISWKEGLAALGSMLILLFLNKTILSCESNSSLHHSLLKNGLNYKLYIQLIFIFAVSIAFSYFFDIEFIFIILLIVFYALTALLLSGLKRDITKNDEVFILNNQYLTCIHAESSEYKGYALNPLHYKKTFQFVQIQSIGFKGQHILIAVTDGLIVPRELIRDDVLKIRNFIEQNHPHLINDQNMQPYIQDRNHWDLIKLLAGGIFILAATVIYFLADNGRDRFKTVLCIVVMLGMLLLCLGYMRYKKSK